VFGLDPAGYLLFVGAALVLLVTPGPAVLFLVSQSLSGGLRAGVATALGLFAGGCAHMLAASLGVSTLLATSAVAFSIVKYAGAAYLVYLGIRELVAKPRAAAAVAGQQRDVGELRQIAVRAAWVNLLNPKAALFFLAFLPQFVHPDAGNVTVQLAILGSTFLGLAVLTDLSYALVSGLIRSRLARSRGRSRLGRFATGGVYIGLGVAAALGSSE